MPSIYIVLRLSYHETIVIQISTLKKQLYLKTKNHLEFRIT